MSPKIRVAIDAKNLALYSGGIANWFSPLLSAWLLSNKSSKRYDFFVIAPTDRNLKSVEIFGEGNMQLISPSWPTFLSRQLRHVLYDNWIFPRLIKQIKPQCIISPYHDVLLPQKGSKILSILTVHDLCFLEVPEAYPWAIRHYYLWMLRRNLQRAHHILTVSETTCQQLVSLFHISENSISVIPNTLAPEFLEATPTSELIADWKARHLLPCYKAILYASGIGHRKNIERMLNALRLLWSQGHKIQLFISGEIDARWKYLFSEVELASKKIIFLGFLSLSDLRLAYESVEAVIYPSLCEGFGRSCLEAMVCGTPLACSDIAVFHEVAGGYPRYFDPFNIESIALALTQSLEQSRPKPYLQSQYEAKISENFFIETMNTLILESNVVIENER